MFCIAMGWINCWDNDFKQASVVVFYHKTIKVHVFHSQSLVNKSEIQPKPTMSITIT